MEFGDPLTKDELDKIIKETDEDNDGYINYEEFVIKLMNERKDNDIAYKDDNLD